VRFEEADEQLDLILKLIKLALQSSIAIGGLLIFIYCGRIGSFPSGLTVGDGLLFIAVTLSFGFSYSIAVFFLFCTAIMLTPFWRIVQATVTYIYRLFLKITRQPYEENILKFPSLNSNQFGVVVLGAIGLILIITSYFKDIYLFIGLASSVALMAFAYLLLNAIGSNEIDLEDRAIYKNKTRIVFILAIYFIPLAVGRFQGNLLDQTMRLIGIRNESAIIQFQEDYREFIELILNKKGKNIFKAKILFYGFGTNSVLELEGKRFIVPNDQYRLSYE